MSLSADNEVVIELKDGESDGVLAGVREGRFVRLSRGVAERFSSIRELLGDDDTLNNIWGVIETESGELLTEGQKLYARIRIRKPSGRFVIAATTVVLGTVVAVTAVQQSHKKR
jgi:hypothetical protein